MKQVYGVIGLGLFGSSVARSLAELGEEVIAVDKDDERVRELADQDVYALRIDATSKEAMREAGLQNADTVVIAIGEAIEASILAAMICKELGVSRLIARAENDVHADVLRHIGVERVVFPEQDMGTRLAQNLTAGFIIDFIDMDPDVAVMEITPPRSFIGKPLRLLQLPRKFGIHVLAVQRGRHTVLTPGPDDVIQSGDVMIVLGAKRGIERLRRE